MLSVQKLPQTGFRSLWGMDSPYGIILFGCSWKPAVLLHCDTVDGTDYLEIQEDSRIGIVKEIRININTNPAE